jgi:hypothetical protein
MADDDDDDDETGKSPNKRVAKKKHYPFGTPAHTHHPFSEFSHLPVATRGFALDLATATDIKPEVIEEEPLKQTRRRPITSPKKGGAKSSGHSNHGHGAHGEDESVGSEGSMSKTEASDLQPCTKIPCQMVIRAIGDMEYKNELEKYDLEDEMERLATDLKYFEQEVHTSEQKLDKMNDFGNQLEIKLNQIMNRVEHLEKTKESLQQERTDINSKVTNVILSCLLLLLTFLSRFFIFFPFLLIFS